MMDSAQFLLETKTSPTTQPTDAELEYKVKKASEKISENLHIFANEPSLACYRLQEHIQKSLPQMVIRRMEVNHIQRDIQGKCYDLDYCINALKLMQRSENPLSNIHTLLLAAINTKQQLSQKEIPKTEPKRRSAASMYQRFSGSFDLPAAFLPSGLSSSASASADLKSSTSAGPQRTLPASRRTRASSVSSTSSNHPTVSRAHSASCSPAPKKTTLP